MSQPAWTLIAHIEQEICDIEGRIATLCLLIELLEDSGDVRLPAVLVEALAEELKLHHRLRRAIFRHGLPGR
ncbi:hypothetical protein [Methylobacterium sp. ap11]|uniref:hypothetical protein n=1 Tax=Methylobacterium sp. ap11 TaxID=1761799 RepID=UPI0011601BD5|nr:hypothetical protein [Methylobacterium sp. ap11]